MADGAGFASGEPFLPEVGEVEHSWPYVLLGLGTLLALGTIALIAAQQLP